ncbi:hypothetical protein [Streptomyces griseoluteus]|uniref:hypothetical protein n=1 Tax=Streptomyces griseoluteus TaxID=29306 RepID=UPI0034470655
MSNEIDHAWVEVLQRCDLQVVEECAVDALPVNSAIYAVNGVGVEPVASIPFSSPEAMGELSRVWHARSTGLPLYDQEGRFLLMPPGAGGSKVGWVKVRDRTGTGLPSRIASVTGSPEFMALSLDGCRICAVSIEDYEYWVIVHEFT